ncbi:zinc metallochaperone AztD [Agrococcus citreus]|uniref:Zinc metallochaperone AztD n=1 Tax=Agrococcus citreus TaxID=84643 RepID=A0ABP4JBL4_9MICO
MSTTQRRALTLASVPLSIALLASCAAAPSAPSTPDPSPAPTQGEAPASVEVAASRIAVTVPGGIAVLDAASLEPVSELELDGFLRLHAAGDDRSILVTAPGGFRVLDTGVEIAAHGDHEHFHAVEPTLGDIAFPAEHPGHVTVHAGTTALFDDGTGEIVTFDSDSLLDGAEQRRETSVPDAHHGVAVRLETGGLVTTEGTEEARSTVVLRSGAGDELARTDACPGVHGEAVAADDAVLLGCEDGVVVLQDGAFTHIAAPDAYGRIGNVRGHGDSTVVLGDYKGERDAELERPTRVSLIDTATAELRLVELGTSYSFRSLARGPHGEALVLGTDGAVHVIDPATGAVTQRVQVVEPWEEPLDWQQPRPTLVASDHTLYVTDPATQRVLALDAHSLAVTAETTLDGAPNELTAAR